MKTTHSMRLFKPTRRGLLAASLQALATSGGEGQNGPSDDIRRLNVVCVGAHPDDPESGCGGTLLRYSQAGHKVSVIYLTRGERGIPGKSLAQAAAIRTAEAEQACGVLGAQPVFAGQIDGATEINLARVDEFTKIFTAEQPHVVFTHWPIDTHMDHQVAALLTLRAYYAMSRHCRLYFFEVDAGSQTQGFRPTDYIDITAVREKKKMALFLHKSQHGDQIYREHHEVMENYRGREAGVPAAEAFVHLYSDRSPEDLPLI